MSWLGRLFGGRRPEDRLRDALRLESEGELGLARTELEGAIGAARGPDGLSDRDLAEAKARLLDVTDRLARARLTDARAHLEANDAGEARAAIELVRSLGPSDAIARECRELEAALRALETPLRAPDRKPERGRGAPGMVLGGESPLGDAPLVLASDDDDDDEDAEAIAAPVGDDHLDPLEQVLLTFPLEEAERLDALAAGDPDLALALSQRGATDAGAIAAWGRVSRTSSADPLVRREHARALLVAQREKEARPLLETVLRDWPDDLDTLELLMEARLFDGDSEAAAAIARALLGDGRVRDLAMVASVLARTGYAAEALTAVDRALDRAPKAVELWELRGSLCHVLGSAEGTHEADEQAFSFYRQKCVSCGPTKPPFPLASGRRIATRGLDTSSNLDRKQREELADLVRTLATIDAEREAEWRLALARL